MSSKHADGGTRDKDAFAYEKKKGRNHVTDQRTKMIIIITNDVDDKSSSLNLI